MYLCIWVRAFFYLKNYYQNIKAHTCSISFFKTKTLALYVYINIYIYESVSLLENDSRFLWQLEIDLNDLTNKQTHTHSHTINKQENKEKPGRLNYFYFEEERETERQKKSDLLSEILQYMCVCVCETK